MRALARQLHVSERTIGRDLAELRRRGVEVAGIPGRTGGVQFREASGDGIGSDSAISRTDDPFVGRNEELGALADALALALDGETAIVTVRGEPGIGKTRLVRQFTSVAPIHGCFVAWGRCRENGGSPPYWPWIQILRRFAESSTNDPIHCLADEARDVLSQIEPSSERELTLDIFLEPGPSELFKVHDAVNRYLGHAAAEQPLVLVLDDLHAADTSSLGLLEFLAIHPPAAGLLLLATYRDTYPDAGPALLRTVARLERGGVARELGLSGLAPEETSVLASQLSGDDRDGRTASTIHDLTAGNPLLVTHYAASGVVPATQRHGITSDTPVPDSVRAFMTERLESLSVRCNRVLRCAAIAGNAFSVDLLVSVLSTMADGDLQRALAEAVDARLVERAGISGREYRFSHGLLRRAIEAATADSERMRLHSEIGLAVEHVAIGALEPRLAELAVHFAQADQTAYGQKAIGYALAAGRQALASHSWEEAADIFARGLESPALDPVSKEAGELWFGLGRAQGMMWGNERSGTIADSLTRAFDIFVSLGDRPKAVEVAGIYIPQGQGRPATGRLLERGLELAIPGSPGATGLMVRLGLAYGLEENRLQDARDIFAKATCIARSLGNTGLEARALGAEARVEMNHALFDSALEKALMAAEVGLRSEDADAAIYAWMAANICWRAKGQIDQSISAVNDAIRLSEREGYSEALARAHISRAHWSLDAGDWDLAREHIDRALDINPFDALALCFRALIEVELGDVQSSQEYLQRTIESMTDENGVGAWDSWTEQWVAFAFAWIGLLTGDAALLRRSVAILDGLEVSPHMTRLTRRRVLCTEGLIHVARRDEVAVGRLYRSSFRPDDELEQMWEYPWLPGLLAWTAREFDDARYWFDTAIAYCEPAGLLRHLARCHRYYGEMLSSFDTVADLNNATEHLAKSRRIAEVLGMLPLLHEVEELDRRLARHRDETGLGGAGTLTRREREVLELLRAGMTYQEIADRLVISRHTVDFHARNIYSKTGARNRAEVGRFRDGDSR